MIDINDIKNIYFCGIPAYFGGTINSFQIKVRMLFKENQIQNNLFIFTDASRKQAKMYYENKDGTWLHIYRLKEGRFLLKHNNNKIYKISKDQFKLILIGSEIIKHNLLFK